MNNEILEEGILGTVGSLGAQAVGHLAKGASFAITNPLGRKLFGKPATYATAAAYAGNKLGKAINFQADQAMDIADAKYNDRIGARQDNINDLFSNNNEFMNAYRNNAQAKAVVDAYKYSGKISDNIREKAKTNPELKMVVDSLTGNQKNFKVDNSVSFGDRAKSAIAKGIHSTVKGAANLGATAYEKGIRRPLFPTDQERYMDASNMLNKLQQIKDDNPNLRPGVKKYMNNQYDKARNELTDLTMKFAKKSKDPGSILTSFGSNIPSAPKLYNESIGEDRYLNTLLEILIIDTRCNPLILNEAVVADSGGDGTKKPDGWVTQATNAAVKAAETVKNSTTNSWDWLVSKVAGTQDKKGNRTGGLAGWIDEKGKSIDGKGLFGKKTGENISKLADMMKKSPNLTTGGIAAAGLLGTYYLVKKLFGKKKMEAQDFENVEKLGNMRKLPPGYANERVTRNS